MNASVYKAQTHNQETYFVKLKFGHHHVVSANIMTYLYEAGIEQIILPIKTTHGQPIQHFEAYTLIVFPFIEGEDGFNRDLTDDEWFILGKSLKQIHKLNIPPSLKPLIRREAYSPKWREIVRSLYTYIRSEPRGDEISMKLQKFMNSKKASIRRLLDRAEDLSQRVQKRSDFVLCHSDIHAGNVLINKSGSLYIIDWDEPIMAPKERDLMFVGGGVGNVWNKPHEIELFYKGYGDAEVDMNLLAYYRHERILEDIAVYAQQLLLTTAGGQQRVEWYKQFVAQFEPDGVVELAFKTDKQV